MKIAPGVRLNLSKSGPSLSFGPRGGHITFGRRGIRRTVGIPGTGIYATQIAAPTATPPAPRADLASTPAGPVHYSVAVVVGVLLAALLWLTRWATPASALEAGTVAAVVGMGYEWLAHHHPLAARRLVALAAGLVAVSVVVGGMLLVAVLGMAAVTGRKSR